VTFDDSDGAMSFTHDAAEEFGIPNLLLHTHSACGLLGYTQLRVLVERGLTPLKGIKVVSCSKFKIHVNFGSITVLTPQEMRRVRLTAKKLFL